MTQGPDRIEALRALAERKNKPLHWYGVAMELRAVGRLEEALEGFDRVRALDANYVPAWFMRAQVLEELERVDEARETLDGGIELADRIGDDHAAGEMRSMLDLLPE